MIKCLALIVCLFYSLISANAQGNNEQRYINSFYGIEINFPKKVGYQTFTSESLKYDTSKKLKAAGIAPPDSTIQMLISKDVRIIMLKKELILHDSAYLNTAEFGNLNYNLAKENAKQEIYSNGEFIEFKGAKAFRFDVEERLVTYGLEVNVNIGEPFLTKKGFTQWTSIEGLMKGEKYSIIYFSHRGKYFSVLFLKDSKVAQKIIDNLTLI